MAVKATKLGAPPKWNTVLDYCGLFLFYFTGTLALFVVGAHIVRMLRHQRTIPELISQIESLKSETETGVWPSLPQPSGVTTADSARIKRASLTAAPLLA